METRERVSGTPMAEPPNSQDQVHILLFATDTHAHMHKNNYEVK